MPAPMRARHEGSGTATTSWHYDVYRGWLTNKVYADGKGTIYTNTAAGETILDRTRRRVDLRVRSTARSWP